jgi:hypothetical protein
MLSDPERGFYQTVGKAIVPLRVAGGMVSDFAQGVWHLPGLAYDLVPFGSPATLPMALYNRQPGAPNPMRILGPLTQLSSEFASGERTIGGELNHYVMNMVESAARGDALSRFSENPRQIITGAGQGSYEGVKLAADGALLFSGVGEIKALASGSRTLNALGAVDDVARLGAAERVAGTATYARGSAERAFLLEELRATRGSGATRFAEQRGIVFGHREAGRLGQDPILSSLQYGAGNGLDGLFVSRTTGELAVWEFKGGGSQTGLGSLRTYDPVRQGSQAYIESRLARYSRSPDADVGLVSRLETAIANDQLNSFASFSGSRRTYQLPMNGNVIRPGMPR